MFNEELVRQIVEKVLSSLNIGRRQVMVVITGATIGAPTAFKGLVRLKEQWGDALDYMMLFSKAAAEIHQPEQLGKKLHAAEVLIEGKSSRRRATAALRQCNLVAVPALTRNTAARTALMLLDAVVTEVLIDALMRGLPVIAAKDGADPMSEGFARLGLNRANPGLIGTMAGNLEQIAGYGVNLTSAAEFGGVLEKRLRGLVEPEAPGPPAEIISHHREAPAEPARFQVAGSCGLDEGQQQGRRVIITRADLGALVGSDGVVRVARGAVISPLVRDIVREAGWRLEEA